MTKISGISVCIWDFDGTLYRQQSALWDDIRASEIRVVMEHTGWTIEKAKEEFGKIYNVVTPSGTKTTSMLAHISNAQASIETSRYTDYRKYLTPDPKLNAMFSRLSGFAHYMLVNGSQDSVSRGSALLGLDMSVFTEVVTSEIVGETKPGTKGFLYIMEKTGLPAGYHIMIGDREAVDLVPAKSVGMRTCLVSWGVTKLQTDCVDNVTEEIYTVPELLL